MEEEEDNRPEKMRKTKKNQPFHLDRQKLRKIVLPTRLRNVKNPSHFYSKAFARVHKFRRSPEKYSVLQSLEFVKLEIYTLILIEF